LITKKEITAEETIMNEFGYIATTRVRTAERRVRRNPGRHIVDRRGTDRRDAAVRQPPALPGGLSHLVRALGVRQVRSTGLSGDPAGTPGQPPL
jgi:hypothetical protein